MTLPRSELTSESIARGDAWQALRPRVVDPATSYLTTLLAPGRTGRLSAPSGELRLSARGPLPRPHSSTSSMPSRTENDVLILETSDGPLALSPARDLLRVLTAIDVAPMDDAGLAGFLHQLALDALPPAAMAMFGANGVRGSPPRAPAAWDSSRATRLADANASLEEVELRMQAPGLNLPLRMRGSARALIRVFERAAWRPGRATGPVLPETWRYRAPVVLGCTRLPAATVRALRAGDTILIEAPVLDASGHGALRFGAALAVGTLVLGNRSTWRFTYWADAASKRPEPVGGDRLVSPFLPPMPLDTAMDLDLDLSALDSHDWRDTELSPDHAIAGDDATSCAQASSLSTADSADPRLDSLPVQLRFEVGELVLSLSALRELAPGTVIPIDGALPPGVRVMCSGELLGRGELVELDGRLAVALTQWGGQH